MTASVDSLYYYSLSVFIVTRKIEKNDKIWEKNYARYKCGLPISGWKKPEPTTTRYISTREKRKV